MFGMTFTSFDEKDKELEQGKVLADAIKRHNISNFVFRFILRNFLMNSGGEHIDVPFLDTKHEIELYMRSLNLNHAVYLHTAFFYENLIVKKGMKRVNSTANEILFTGGLPRQLKIPMIAVEDIGRIAAFILMNMQNFSRTDTFNFK